jgi:hypothetical protein
MLLMRIFVAPNVMPNVMPNFEALSAVMIKHVRPNVVGPNVVVPNDMATNKWDGKSSNTSKIGLINLQQVVLVPNP